MKLFCTIFLVLTTCAFTHGEIDPFGSDEPSWTTSILSEKPYTLEVAFGESMVPLPARDDAFDFIMTDLFLEHAKRIRIGVAPEQNGIVEWDNGGKLVYRIVKEDNGFYIHISLTTTEGGKREIDTSLAIGESEWLVIAQSVREEIQVSSADESESAIRLHHYVAVTVRERG